MVNVTPIKSKPSFKTACSEDEIDLSIRFYIWRNRHNNCSTPAVTRDLVSSDLIQKDHPILSHLITNKEYWEFSWHHSWKTSTRTGQRFKIKALNWTIQSPFIKAKELNVNFNPDIYYFTVMFNLCAIPWCDERKCSPRINA